TIAFHAIIAMNDIFPEAVPVLAAHKLVFYFGIVADITPPVALAAFAATGLYRRAPLRTGFSATKLAIAAFIIPYMFVLDPALLVIDTNAFEVILIGITALSGMIAIGAGMIGYWYTKLNRVSRIIATLTGLSLIYPGGV